MSQQQRALGILAGIVGVASKCKPTAQHDPEYSNTCASDPSYIGTFSVRLVVYVGIDAYFSLLITSSSLPFAHHLTPIIIDQHTLAQFTL
jgi:hypothetical protein